MLIYESLDICTSKQDKNNKEENHIFCSVSKYDTGSNIEYMGFEDSSYISTLFEY